ncbi:MAG: PQQ-binding-like beta-propeller repeat protein [Halobacteriota archaeon]
MVKGGIKHANTVALSIVLILCTMVPATIAQLANTSWPMFHHHLNHTGLSPHYGPDTSTVKWTFSTGDKIFGSPAIAADGTIYIGTTDLGVLTHSRFYAINPDGTEKWHWTPPCYSCSCLVDYIDSTPAIASDGTIYVGCWNRRLYALYPNGTLKWEFYDSQWKECSGFVLTSPAIAPDGTIYIGNNNGILYAINSDGSLKWKYQTGCSIQSSPALGPDGTVYVSSYDRNLYAINPDGTLKWRYNMGVTRSSPAIGSDGTVYVGSYDKNLYAIKPDGSLKWRYTTGGYITSSPAIDADGTVYVGSLDGYIYAIKPDGSLLWKYNTGKSYYSSPSIASDGTVYIGTCDGKLYAFDVNMPPVLNSIGPKTVDEGDELNITITASDHGGEMLTFSSNVSFGAFTPINSSVSLWSWTPDYDDAGVYFIEFGVSDGELCGNETVKITVNNVNRQPVLEAIGDRTIDENETHTVDVNATDLDNDTLTYSCSRTDLFTDFNPAIGVGHWITDYDDAGIYSVDFGVSDGKGGIDTETVKITVHNKNRPPVLEPIGDKTVNESDPLEFTINATDPDADTLTYSASNLPPGAAFDTDTGTFSWTPFFEQSGVYPGVHFEVRDGELADWENFTIAVNTTNRPPILEPIGNKTVNESNLLEFTINGTDPDEDTLIYSASNLPAGVTFDPGTRTFSWKPSFEQSGTYPDVHFKVSDGELADYEDFTIVVNDVNRPPELQPIEDNEINETETLMIDVNATDPDGDSLTYSCNCTDLFTYFSVETGFGHWTIDYDDAGIYYVDFGVSDGRDGIDNKTVKITVNDVNRPPMLEPIGNKAVSEGDLLTFIITAADPDGNSLAYSAFNLPAGATFNSSTRIFSWIPSSGQTGIYSDVHFEVSDGDELIDFEDITITVKEGVVEISVEPKNINVQPQDEFDVNITVDSPGNSVHAVQYCLHYNTSVVRAETQAKRSFLGNPGETIIVINRYQSTAVLCSCSHDPDYPGKDGNISYIRWAFGDGQYGTSEGLPVDNCTCKEHRYESWLWNSTSNDYAPFTAVLTVTDDGCPEMENSTTFPITVYIAGDANGDGEVNVLDVVRVGKNWRRECPATNPCANCTAYLWDDEQVDSADLNNDCEINVLDVVIIGANWRHTAW